MDVNQTGELVGFYRPAYVGAGFAIPVFRKSSELCVQVIKDDAIADFAECDVTKEEIINSATLQLVTKGQRVDSKVLRQSIGEPALYAFQLSSTTVLLDERVGLLAALKSTIPKLQLYKNRYLSKDIDEFFGNGRIVAEERKPAEGWRRSPQRQVEIQPQIATRSIRKIIKRAPTKEEILAQISKDSELSRKQVSEVFESLNGIIRKSLRSNGLFTLPGLLKLKVVKRPATKARDGINPFTGEKMTFKARRAGKKIRVMAVKRLKDIIA